MNSTATESLAFRESISISLTKNLQSRQKLTAIMQKQFVSRPKSCITETHFKTWSVIQENGFSGGKADCPAIQIDHKNGFMHKKIST